MNAESEFVDALQIVLNAIVECQAHLASGDLSKARAELEDPLLKEAIDEIEIFKLALKPS